jgi:hypothetical protein
MGASEWICGWVNAKILANWIPPDVTRNIFRRFVWTQDVIIVAALPKALSGTPGESESGSLFKALNKGCKVAGFFGPLRKKVKVVGHYAISMNSKSVLGRCKRQFLQ